MFRIPYPLSIVIILFPRRIRRINEKRESISSKNIPLHVCLTEAGYEILKKDLIEGALESDQNRKNDHDDKP